MTEKKEEYQVKRRTNIPIQGNPDIVNFLIKNCTIGELEFMADLAGSQQKFKMLNSIFTRLTDFNVHQVFYNPKIQDNESLIVYRAARRGEVAGLKAFAYACQVARQELQGKKEQQKKKRRKHAKGER